jgi:hypothetical protein
MVGHKSEAICRRYAIADESMLKSGGGKLAAIYQADKTRKTDSVVVAFQQK